MPAEPILTRHDGLPDPADFLMKLDPGGGAQNARLGAIDRYKTAELPSRRHEEWKWTDPRVLSSGAIALRPTRVKVRYTNSDHPDYAAVIEFTDELVTASIVPRYARSLSITACSDSSRLPASSYPTSPRDKISLINDVFWTGGFALAVANGAAIDMPIKVTEKSSIATAHKSVIEIGESSSATIIHETERSADTFNELWISLNKSANLSYYSAQRRSPRAIDVSRENVVAQRDSACSWYALAQGSRLTKLNQNCFLLGQGARCMLSEAGALGTGENIHVVANFVHARPNTTCDIRVNMAATGATASSFRGQIFIDKESSNSDAMLAHKSLLLTGGATVNSIPVLEILANDVRCKHASSQGRIDDDQLFYLRSRGISEESGKRLITEGFIGEVFSFDSDAARGVFESFIGEVVNRSETQLIVKRAPLQ